MSYDFDLIIVGGGLAGLSASITAAREGLSVLVLERGNTAGLRTWLGEDLHPLPQKALPRPMGEEA
jgi:Dehydrogenases (flavoproteins)